MKIRKKTFGFDDLLIVPRASTIESRSQVDLTVKLGPLSLGIPIVSSNMDTITEFEMASTMERLGGLGIIHRYLSTEKRLEQAKQIQDLRHRAMAIGVTKEEILFAKRLLDEGVNVLCLDVAHGHSTMMQRALGELRDYAEGLPAAKFNPLGQVILIAGNVATPEGSQDLESWGADAIKVGIGPGSMCTTRIVTGAGFGQLTAIADCSAAVKIPIIADGGIRNSGDATKAILAGASIVMLGRLLAGTNEVPAWARKGGVYRGMASAEAQGSHYGYDFTDRHPEGVATRISSKGSVAEVLGPFLGGIRSGFSYIGARTVNEAWERAEFVECAPGVVAESLPHGLLPEYGREMKRS